jgi:hypothetical protein
MGISDKDYGDALLQKHIQAHQEQLELFKNEDNGSLTYTTKNRYNDGITLNNIAHPRAGVRPLTEQDIQGEAMQAPLSSLVDMWLMRWSGTWVSESDFQEDNFWRVALIRLLGANKVEKHHLADRIGAVYRVIE